MMDLFTQLFCISGISSVNSSRRYVHFQNIAQLSIGHNNCIYDFECGADAWPAREQERPILLDYAAAEAKN